jgi:hypothetical protein
MSFQGSLQELPVPDIIQLVSVSGKTGMFTLTRGGETGHIFLRDGRIVHAELGQTSGEEAVYALAIWSTGEFQFTPGRETDILSIDRTNTSLLMEAARRLDEWKVLSRKVPAVDSVPVLKPRRMEAVTLSPPEWNLVICIDGRKSVDELARETHTNAFDTAKVLYGLVTADLVEMRLREAARPPTGPAAARSAPGTGAGPVPSAARSVPPLPTPGGADEKKILMILCTRVKQEAEAAIGEANLPGIDRPYKQALADIDRGRGVEAVRDLIRQTEKAISSIRGPAIMRAFQEKMSLVMQPKV